jgi:hypothetical protein
MHARFMEQGDDMSISISRAAGPAVCHGAPAPSDNTAPGSARQAAKGTASDDTAACAMFAAHGARYEVAAHATHIAPPLRLPDRHGLVPELRPTTGPTGRLRRAAGGPAPDTALSMPNASHTVGKRALQATLDRWEHAGEHQDIVAAYRDAVADGGGLDSVSATTRRVALYDTVVKSWRQDGTFDKVVSASMDVLKQGGAYEVTIQRFREGFYPHLNTAQAEKKFLADFADWDNMSPTDKRITFIWYVNPRRMLDDDSQERDNND